MKKLTYSLSFWERETFFKGIDVAVVGSGIVGLAAAIHLKRKNPALNVVVLERGPLPIGASTRNAGFACIGSMTELLADIELRGEDEVLAVVEKRWRGLAALRSLLGDDRLHYKANGGWEMFTDDDDEIFRTCRERMPDLNQKIGAITGHSEVFSLADDSIRKFGFRGVSHLVRNAVEGQVDTGRMMEAYIELAQSLGIRIFNGIDIEKMDDGADGVHLLTGFGWEIRARKVLVCVNGFAQRLLDVPGINPARNQVLITKPIPGLRIEGCFHYDRGYFYFRNIDGRILLGGGRNLSPETELTDQFGNTDFIKSALIRLLHGVIVPGQSVEVDGWWSGILGIGLEKKPIVEKVSPNVSVAVRLSGMGVAIGTLVGQEGAELAMSDE